MLQAHQTATPRPHLQAALLQARARGQMLQTMVAVAVLDTAAQAAAAVLDITHKTTPFQLVITIGTTVSTMEAAVLAGAVV